ncbi:MAG: amidohydrolase [Chloroflexota bacterium]|nr:amidohydrolase [Chloroflexota bacterium]
MNVSTSADLILRKATVLTMDVQQPIAEAVAISGDRILSVGTNESIERFRSRYTRIIDCNNLLIHPGFVDAHIHPLAFAKHLSGVKCSGPDIQNINDIVTKLNPVSIATSSGEWITGVDYDDETLTERRHPNRWDLDVYNPDNPVRLIHRSGHAVVLNSCALKLAGIDANTPDPIDGVIVRSSNSTEPTGVFLDANDFLRQRLGVITSEADIARSMGFVNDVLLSYGITSIQDAGHNNGLYRWNTLQRLIASQQLQTRITMMVSGKSVLEFHDQGRQFGAGDLMLRLGHVKEMLTSSTGTFLPSLEDLTENVRAAHKLGFPVAIHAVEEDAVRIATVALTDSRCNDLPAPDRIEHCSEAPLHIRQAVSECGATVVTQPGFLYWRKDHYGKHFKSEVLYPIESLRQTGIPVAFSSDAPVIDPNPWPGIHAILERSSQAASYRAFSEYVPNGQIYQALYAYTVAAARTEGLESLKGSLVRGKLADLVVSSLSHHEEIANPENVSAAITIINGQIVRDVLTQ